MTATQRLVGIARNTAFEQLPPDVVRVAEHCTLDYLGVTLLGAREPAAAIVAAQVAPDTRGPATLIGLSRSSDVLGAALVNGVAAHALDYDDTHWGMQGHPTAPVLSALLPVAEREDASGARFIAALVAGVEVECRLGRWLNPSHYQLGFHATGTLGTFGAAAAVAHLLELDAERFAHALGLAATQAAGLKSGFGSMAKPLHVGKAAHAGALAALLAASGFTGNPEALETAQGFAVTHAQAERTDAALDRGSGRFAILDTLFKFHAACHLTHAAIDGVRELAAAQALAPDEVSAIELHVDPTCLAVCNIERPRTGMEAKFSLRAAAAMALLGDDTADPRAWSDARATDPALARVMQRVHVHASARPATQVDVALALRDGRNLRASHDSGVPERDLARQGERVAHKLDRICPWPAARRAELIARVRALATLPSVRALTQIPA
jgi:2-methylcitrate dehydratase PrpD